jgi:hypothetical protein
VRVHHEQGVATHLGPSRAMRLWRPSIVGAANAFSKSVPLVAAYAHVAFTGHSGA